MSNESKVFLQRGSYEHFLRNPILIVKAIEQAGFAKEFKKNDFVGLKLHFGEKGNKSFINPNLLLPLVQFLKKRGMRPFLFETNTLYRGERMNALDHINLAMGHGFGKLNIPIVIGDGMRGNDNLELKVNQEHFKTCFLAKALEDVDCLLVLSHFTCHMLTGFGAALKNLGMGCASRKGKLAQHCEVSPQINKDKCNACNLCADNCPAEAIEKGDKCFILKEKCIGCAQCISICPQGAVEIIWSEEYNAIGEKMVEYAYAVGTKKRCAYVNVCLFITKECDCMSKEEQGFIEDIGILYSLDPVSIDKASVDLILEHQGRDVIKAAHPKIDYLHHLRYAESIGLGSLDYTLIEI
jgi:uncharacterized Fe-S center protein